MVFDCMLMRWGYERMRMCWFRGVEWAGKRFVAAGRTANDGIELDRKKKVPTNAPPSIHSTNAAEMGGGWFIKGE